MKKTIVLLTGAVCLWGCKGAGNTTESSDMTLEGDLVCVAESSPVLRRMEIETVTTAPYNAVFTTSGAVKAIPSAYAEIAAPFAGRIVKSHIRLGQQVGKGAPLFEYLSPEYAETCRDYLDAAREAEQAAKALARAKDLQKHGVGSVRETEEAELDHTLKRQALDQAEAALRVFGAEPSEVRPGAPLVVRAPIAGKVVADRIVIGQYVREDAEALAVVADLKKVWVAANVKEKDLRSVEHLQEVEIALASAPEEPVRGRILHIGDLLDEETRSTEVIVECDNADGRMKPNMYAQVRLTGRAVESVVVPTSAILQQEQSCFVFTDAGEGRFRKTPVEVVATQGDRSVIGRGVAPGERIVVRGAFYLLDAK